MMTRGSFVLSAGATFAVSITPVRSPLPSPAPSSHPLPTATPFPWDLCEENPILPYDHPLGLRMRVLDGPDFDLQHYRGYAVVMNIFATWCGPCMDEMPALVAAAARYHDAGLRIIGINYAESDDTVRAFRKKYGIAFPIAMDERGGYTYSLEHGDRQVVTAFPVLLFISPDGYLYCYKKGSTRHPEAELTYRFEKFLKDQPPYASPSPAPTKT